MRRETLRPVPRRNLIEWADEFRRLSKKAAAKPGRWRTAKVPMALGPTFAVTDPRVRTISAMAPTQEFKTELILNAAGYYVHQDPSPILMVLPTDKLGESFSKDRLSPLIDETPAIAAIGPDSDPTDKAGPKRKARSSDDTLTRKAFASGAVIDIVGANSPTDLSSRPKRVVLADEIDKFPASTGKEGNPLRLTEKRQSTFWNAKSIRACSPTRKGFSNIGREYAMSDQSKLFVRCPHCGDAQVLSFERVRWDKSEDGEHDPDTAGYECRSCGVLWDEKDRRAAVKALVDESDFGWRQTKPFKCCGAEHKPLDWRGDENWNAEGEALCPTCRKPAVPVAHRGFNASRLYSLNVSMPEVVQEFLDSKDDPDLLQPFVNTTLAEEFEEGKVKVDANALLARREAYGYDDVPNGALIVTAGVDVQDDRLEVEVVGWGAGSESWGLGYEVLHGDPAQDQVWHALEAILLRTYTRQDRRPLRVQAACIDTGGHYTERVYDFTRPRYKRRVYAIKGDGGAAKPIWPKRASRSRSNNVLFMVGSNAATDQIYAALRVKEPGYAGYCHFAANYDAAYFDQLLAEKLTTRRVGGQNVRAYECPKGKRNEAHDCRRYALAALKSLNVALPPGRSSEPVMPATAEDSPAAADQVTRENAPAAPTTTPQPKPRRRRRRGMNDSGESWL